MRIRVRVRAPVERLLYARQTSRFHIRTGAQPEIAPGRLALKREIWSWHRDGVAHRLSWSQCEAPAQPVNNAGQAIQAFEPAGGGDFPVAQSDRLKSSQRRALAFWAGVRGRRLLIRASG